MIVMKFGGMSLADAVSIERVIEIIRKHLASHPVVVNSAMGKTTRHLLTAAELSASGNLGEAKKTLEEIHQYHFDLIDSLISDSWRVSASKIIEGYFHELQKLLDGLSVLQELTPRAQDKFLSYGELISTAIVSAALNAKNMKSTLMDARKLIVTDENFTGARPILELTYRKIRKAISPKLKVGLIPIVQGFIGSTQKGITTTLGFEGSDLTASLVAAALDASDIQIWKEVSGIMTADPDIVPDARTVKILSFDEVEELTYFGARVFYSRAVEPARKANIPVHIYNSKSPEKTGTEVVLKSKPCKNVVKSISFKDGLQLVHIDSEQNMSKSDLITSVFRLLDKSNVDPKILQISKNSVTLVVDNSVNLESFLSGLKHFGKVDVKNGKATVSLVGENVRDRQDMAGTIFKILKTQSVDLISSGVSTNNFTIVIDERDLKTTMRKLHDYYFKTLDPSVFE
jgi:aspartate kinase